MSLQEYKLVFVGPMGAGKTTAISAISEIRPVTTEAANTRHSECDKDTTTVAMDYGELTLPDGARLRLYGTPGQERFEFMWQIHAKGALGVVVLIDGSRPDPLADLTLYAGKFAAMVGASRMVVGVSRYANGDASVSRCAALLRELGIESPVVSADVRRPRDVRMLLEILFTRIEVAATQSGVSAPGRDFASDIVF